MTSSATDSGRLRVLISASSGELPEEREAADSAVRTMRLTRVLAVPGTDAPTESSQVFIDGWSPTQA